MVSQTNLFVCKIFRVRLVLTRALCCR